MKAAVLLLGIWMAAYPSQVDDDPFQTGLTLVNPKGCPIFVMSVGPGSPADQAGVHAGDKLLAVDGKKLTNLNEAIRLLRQGGRTNVALTVSRGDKEQTFESGFVKQSSLLAGKGLKAISGVIVPINTTTEEVAHLNAFDGRRQIGGVFYPTHYPARPELYYPGFEIFVLRGPPELAVGGMEDGPARKAGVHSGDLLISVNGVHLATKTSTELENLLSSVVPASMSLEIDRLGSRKTFEFRLESAGEIARQNGKRFVDGRLVPIWAVEPDLHCFLR
jgi:S1-C subfamily serine protease